MARMIFICRKCNSTYGADSGTHNLCPNCGIPLIETSITTDYWHTLSDYAKEQTKKEQQYHFQIASLKAKGADGYYEYKVIRLSDVVESSWRNSARKDAEAMAQILNELGADGWRLATAYTHFGDDTLIFERFVKI